MAFKELVAEVGLGNVGVVLAQTVLNQVRAGKRDAVQVVDGKRPGLRIDANGDHDTLC